MEVIKAALLLWLNNAENLTDFLSGPRASVKQGFPAKCVGHELAESPGTCRIESNAVARALTADGIVRQASAYFSDTPASAKLAMRA